MPTLNEASNIPARARELEGQAGPLEWIVVDGGSTDATVDAAARAGARIVHSPRGRGQQLDSGAAAATGQAFLFLHADTALAPGALDAIRAALRDGRVVGGNFALRFSERGATATVFAWGYALQQRFLQTFYGDSAIFVRASTFSAIGGFGSEPLMEDYAFVRRLYRAGAVERIGLVVTTSSRRYAGRPVRMLMLWAAILALYRLGVPTRWLVRLYHRRDRR